MSDSLWAYFTLIVDAPDEPGGMALVRGFLDRAGLEANRLIWKPYPKLGPHSRVSCILKLPPAADPAGAVEAVCALAVAQPDKGYRNAFQNDDGSLYYNRIFDARTEDFLLPGLLWLDIEINTNHGAQADCAAHAQG